MRKRGFAIYGACEALFRLSGVGCCQSCADDAADGYDDLCEIKSPSDFFVGRVCCAHANLEPYDEYGRRTWWAILVREIRRAG